MYSQILSKEDYGKIVSASPDSRWAPLALARETLAVLQSETQKPSECRLTNTGGDTTYSMLIGQLARRIPDGPTPRSVGQTLANMGLERTHTREGNLVIWNQSQITLLQKALEAK
jgi:hypothetical protein